MPDVPRRRFPPPWTAKRIPGDWRVEDATGYPLAYVYGTDEPQVISSTAMTLDEARRIAANIARIPDYLRK
jgi:hypothetical protein